MYDTGVLVRGDLLLLDPPAVIVAAGLRHEDLDNPVTATVMDDDLPSCAHSDQDRGRLVPLGLFLSLVSTVMSVDDELSVWRIVVEPRSFMT